MNIVNCIDHGRQHRYGLWNEIENGTKGCRTCEKCGFQRILPMTEEISDQIQKQKEAVLLLKKLKEIDLSDKNIIGYLYAFLEDYTCYLDKVGKSELIGLMKQLAVSDYISMENATYIEGLSLPIESENDDALKEQLDIFYEYNKQIFSTLLETEMNEG